MLVSEPVRGRSRATELPCSICVGDDGWQMKLWYGWDLQEFYNKQICALK